MKENYEKPIVELDEFETQDVLTVSDEDTGNVDPPWGGEIVPPIF